MIKISKFESGTIDPQALAFAPIEYMNCNFDGSILTECFLITPDLETENDYLELEQVLTVQLGHNNSTVES